MIAKDIILKKAFLLSLALHSLLLLPWPVFLKKHMIIEKKAQKKSSPPIIYYRIAQKSKLIAKKAVKKSPPREKVKKEIEYQKEQTKLPKDKKTDKKKQGRSQLSKLPSYVKAEKGIISLGDEKKLEKVPEVILDYYRAIREEIKQSALLNRPRGSRRGEVTVIFELSSDGILQNIYLDPQRSVKDEVLQESALKSIKMASPFPPFPKELKAEEITFSITIEFALGY